VAFGSSSGCGQPQAVSQIGHTTYAESAPSGRWITMSRVLLALPVFFAVVASAYSATPEITGNKVSSRRTQPVTTRQPCSNPTLPTPPTLVSRATDSTPFVTADLSEVDEIEVPEVTDVEIVVDDLYPCVAVRQGQGVFLGARVRSPTVGVCSRDGVERDQTTELASRRPEFTWPC